jgi:GTPase involved in cell partitioning and DNA repair
MKKEKAIKELKIERPRRTVVSEKEALKRMKDFLKRKEQFLVTARTGKGRGIRS